MRSMSEPPSPAPSPTGVPTGASTGAARPEPAGESAAGARAIFAAVLHPHRSLSPAGFAVLMTVVGVVSLAAGTAFLLAGAWPVFGFFGLDAALIYVAFRTNYRSARLREMVRLTEDALTVRRVFPSGAERSWTLQPHWLRVEMDDPPEHHSQLRLRSRGRALVIGSFLTPGERLELARALEAALRHRHAPARA